MKKVVVMLVLLGICGAMWAEEPADRREIRAVWFSSAWLRDWPEITDDTSREGTADRIFTMFPEDQLYHKGRMLEMIDSLKAVGCNTVIFQTVSFMDAMHRSSFLPWSRYLTGTEGMIPIYDPLRVAVERCHELGMDIHAWMNPYRVGFTSRTYAPNHPMWLHPEWLQEYNGSYYWNPGIPEVREFIAGLVKEVLENYDVDGVHIDDYFYPSGLQKDQGTWDDSAEYEMYGDTLSVDEWRYRNVDETIKLLYETVHATRPDALFGVSPAGRLVNTQLLYADPSRWIGYMDYIVPQIYWQIEHPLEDARFDKQIHEWPAVNVPGVPVIAGMAIYRYGEKTRVPKGAPAAIFDDAQYRRQMKLVRAEEGVYGQMWFSARGVLDHFDLIKSFYRE